MSKPTKRDDARYRALHARFAGLKYALDVAGAGERAGIIAEQDSILAELSTLAPAVIGDSEDAHVAADLRATDQRAWEREIDARVAKQIADRK